MEHHTGIIILVVVSLALLLGALVRHLLKNTHIPYSVALLLIGLAIGFAERLLTADAHSFFSDSLDLVAAIDPHLILFIFLPTLIFESAFAIESHLFKRTFAQVAILAVPGLLICTALTAVLVKTALPWQWSWPVALLFGALISATDPVAVVSLLKEMSSRKRLETLIEGESLLNDGTAIVLFTVFLGFVVSSEQSLSLLTISFDFVKVVALGLIIGLVVGFLLINWMTRIFNDPMLETTLSIVAAYLAFYLAEDLLHVSGVVAVVTLAITLSSVGRTRISPEVEGFLHHFWEMMAYIANTIIFLIVGVIIAKRVQLDSLESWLALLLLYLGVNLIRGLAILSLGPALKRVGIGLNKEKSLVMVWGGLRGAVALALALSVAQHSAIPKAVGDQILFLTAGIVVLTILINGSSIRWLLAALGLDSLPAAKQATVDKAEANIQHTLHHYLGELKHDPLLKHADWPEIEQSLLDSESLTQNEVADSDSLLVAFKRRILEAERKHYWSQYAEGTLGAHAVNALVDGVELALDGEPQVNLRKGLEKYWQLPRLAEWLLKSPVLNPLCSRWGNSRLLLAYDISRGFLRAQQQSLEHLKKLSPPGDIYQQIENQLVQNCDFSRKNMTQLQTQFPQTVKRLETYVAKRLMLNQRRHKIAELAHDGVLDTPEAERLTHKVEKSMERLAKELS